MKCAFCCFYRGIIAVKVPRYEKQGLPMLCRGSRFYQARASNSWADDLKNGDSIVSFTIPTCGVVIYFSSSSAQYPQAIYQLFLAQAST